MKWFLELLAKLFGKQDPKPVPVPEPTPPVELPVVVPVDDKASGDPNPVHAAVYSTDGCNIIVHREAGYVNNAANSRNTVKTILPEKYTDKVARCVYFDGKGFTDSPKRGPSHEVGNRERFYGTMPVASYPKSGMWVRWDCVVNGVAKDFAYWVKNPQVREG